MMRGDSRRGHPNTSGPGAGEACFAVRRRKSVLLLPGFSPGGGEMRTFTRLAIALLVAGVVFLGAGRAQKPPLLAETEVAALANELSGETAKRNLEGIARFHRQRGSRGFHEAAELVAERLRAYGLSDVAILQFPTDGKIFYGTQRSRPAWDAEVGELEEVKEGKEVEDKSRSLAAPATAGKLGMTTVQKKIASYETEPV